MKIIDKYLNKITMYRLTLYYLIALVGVAVGLSSLGLLSYNPFEILLSTGIVVVSCYCANFVFARLFKAVTNIESVFITSLIIVIIFPSTFPENAIAFIIISVFAMGSKYLLTIKKRHIFNPAAIAVLMFSSLFPSHAATWWIGTPQMFLPVLIGGLLLVRKVQREKMVITFIVVWILLIGSSTLVRNFDILNLFESLKTALTRSAGLFFAFVMLTEPLTSPTTKRKQTLYSAFVALLYSTPQLRLFGVIFTPEWALILGNVFSLIINPQYRFVFNLQKKSQLSSDTYEFNFSKPDDFKFTPGQYLEWTLPHEGADSRGNRRYFSIASSPTEDVVSLLVKLYESPSSYKRKLVTLEAGDEIITTSLAGDFTFPKNASTPVVFIAGGVGIAPFRSMIQNIIDKQIQVDVILLFANRNKEDIVYRDIFEKSIPNGVKTIDILTDISSLPPDWTGLFGHLDEEKIKRVIPDFKNRLFYVSGPQLMVQSFEKILLNIGVTRKRMKIDFFPGYTETK